MQRNIDEMSTEHITVSTMELLFSPCTRYFDLVVENDEGFIEHNLLEDYDLLRELKLDVSVEEFLSPERAFTFADLYAMLGRHGNTVLWLTPHASIVRYDWRTALSCLFLEEMRDNYRFVIKVGGGGGKHITAFARSSAALSEIVDVVCSLLVANTNEFDDLELCNEGLRKDVFCSAPVFASLAEQCQSLKYLKLERMDSLNEDQIHVLGTFSRPGLQVELWQCDFEGIAAEALAEVLGRNQGPTMLDECDIDYSVLANGLRGNSRLKSMLNPTDGDRKVSDEDLLITAVTLKENEGLVSLSLRHDVRVSDETWDAVCDSLKTHPTLELLSLGPNRWIQPFGVTYLASEVFTHRIQALVDMLKVNTSIQRIVLGSLFYNLESLTPYLETNRFRPRLLAIQKSRPIVYRAKVLGRALLAARTDPNRFWMLLSGNAEVAFPSTTATTTVVANLPTPSTVVDADYSVTTVPAAIDGTASASGQKRKACPESQPVI
jgi:hypothetical protein